jgi:hypothetical protein
MRNGRNAHGEDHRRRRQWTLWVCGSVAVAGVASEISGKLLPLLRWVLPRVLIGVRRLRSDWQVHFSTRRSGGSTAAAPRVGRLLWADDQSATR